jgi:diguanylate cyclase (GGDEF)-like protein
LETKLQLQAEFLKISKFQSIKTKILVFALLATIIPASILGGLSYLQSSKLLRGKISHELLNATVQSSKELDLWLKERLYDLRVFSSSYIVSETLSRISGRRRSKIEKIVSLDRIREYLKSVSEKFSVYESLTVLNLAGNPLVTSSGKLSTKRIPDQWREQLKANLPFSGKVRFNPSIDHAAMLIAEEIRASDGSPLGVLVARIHLDSISSMLKLRCTGGIDEIYLTEANGRLLVSSAPTSKQVPDSMHPVDIPPSRPDQIGKLTDYIGSHGDEVIGMAMPIASMGWVMVAEMEKAHAYADIVLLRRITIGLVCGLMLCIGLTAYIFGQNLVRPLRRLSKEAASVASGNLEIDIPVIGFSEVSYLTQVFNHMVASLRHGREEISKAHNSLLETNKELRRLSITDDLTGLHNRKHIMDQFGNEIARAQRYDQSLAILMIDIDYFKRINDTYGHQAGDVVMCRLAESLLGSVRECDHVGRYGGEEFLIILPNSNVQSGLALAERIRQNVSRLQIKDGSTGTISVAVSIGVAGLPDDGTDVESLLRSADKALYHAKNSGRNRVASLEHTSEPPPATNHDQIQNLRLVGRS